jgi:DNA-binding NarL/FixJ family response regulator
LVASERARLRGAMAIRVVLGEDSYLAAEGIARALERAEGIELVSTHGDLDSLEAAVEEQRPDVVLTDIRMPPTHTDEGIRLAVALRESAPEVGVVVLSQHPEPVYATALFEAGSAGRAFLVKERVKDVSELADALRAVAEGSSAVDPLVVEQLVARQRAQSELEDLTPRELEILGLIAEGQNNAAIAEKLVLTKRAVERHINGIFMKLDLGDPGSISRRVRAALIYLAGHDG